MIALDDFYREEDYLKLHPDVAQAVKDNKFINGYHHYRLFGRQEGRMTRIRHVKKSNAFVNVPFEFQIRETDPYPIGNVMEFEYFFLNRFLEKVHPYLQWKYLPITWTAIQRFAAPPEKQKLQEYLNKLPKARYFTICQHDDGIQFKLPKETLVYSSGNANPKYYPIPLIYKPKELVTDSEKNVLFSFIGASTHKIRQELVKYYPNKVFVERYNKDKFKRLINASIFSLCPRGYGATSFRIMESLLCKSIPVYISDDFIEPFNIPFETYGVKIQMDDIWKIPEILKKVNVDALRNNGQEIYDKYFTYEGCYNSILETLK